MRPYSKAVKAAIRRRMGPPHRQSGGEFQAPQALLPEQAVTAFAAAHRRQEAEIIAMAEDLDRQATAAATPPIFLPTAVLGLTLLPWGVSSRSRPAPHHSVNRRTLALLLSSAV